MFELIKAYGFVGLQQFFILLFSLARTKVISTQLGPEGLGVFAQANTFMFLVFQLATFGTSIALNTLLAEFASRGEKQKAPALISQVWGLNTIFGLVILGGCLAFSEPLSMWAFGSARYAGYLVIAGLAGFVFIQVRLLVNTLRGLLEWRSNAVVASVGLVIGIGLVVFLVLTSGLNGAVWSLVALQAVNLGLLLVVFFGRIQGRHGISFKGVRVSTSLLPAAFRIARPVMVILILEPLTDFLVRAEIIRSLGVDLNGQYQVLAGISLAYMNVIKEARLAYTLPKASSLLEDPQQLVKMQNDNIRLGLYLVVPITIGLLTVRELAITLLYSPAFLSVAGLLVWQLVGDIFSVIRYNLNFVLIPLKRYGFYLAEGAIYFLGWLGLSVLFVGRYGLIAVLYAHIGISFFLVLLGLWYHRKVSGFRLIRQTKQALLVLGVLGAFGLAAAVLVPPGVPRYLLAGLALLGIGIDLYRQGVAGLLLQKIRRADRRG